LYGTQATAAPTRRDRSASWAWRLSDRMGLKGAKWMGKR
jgi:hypothetical protein